MLKPKVLEDDEGIPAGFQVVCCPIQLNRSSSGAAKLLQLPSSAIEDTNTPVQLGHTTSLRSTSSSKRSISLNRKQSRPTNLNDGDEDEDEEQPTIDVQRSTSQTRRGDATGTSSGILVQPSRSRSFANSQSDSANLEKTGIDASQTSGDDDIVIQLSPSQSSPFADVQDNIINEEDFVIAASASRQEQEQQLQQRRQRRQRKKCVTVAIMWCAFLFLSAGLVVVFMSTDTLVKQSMQRHSLTGDSDGDGLGDELELRLGLDPMNRDTDGNGMSDGEDVQLVVGASLSKTTKTTDTKTTKTKQSKAPTAPKAPKQTKAPTAPKAPKETKTRKR